MDSVCPKNYVQSHAFYANQIHVESMSWVQSNTQILKTEMIKHNNVVSLNTLNAKKWFSHHLHTPMWMEVL